MVHALLILLLVGVGVWYGMKSSRERVESGGGQRIIFSWLRTILAGSVWAMDPDGSIKLLKFRT